MSFRGEGSSLNLLCGSIRKSGSVSRSTVLCSHQILVLAEVRWHRNEDEHLGDKGNLPYEYKIVIAGNHELTFDKEFMADLVKQDYYRFPSVSKLKPEDFDNVQSLLTNSIYLQDSEVTVKGFRIYGAPWTPWFNGWGFNLPRGQSLLDKWNLIPEGIDILMTHGPPLGFRDWVPKELQRVGCVELLNTVQRRVRPKLHVFGGIHEGYGIMTDGYTTYINASTCTVSFQPTNPPIIFDLPTPQGS
ncbi:metallophosphoesterase MPPED2 isoform X2 [Opisthocomus hoazin]|uniref:metallophosphoesterase MPPED2 isoform X2 n=1 Tax=Opisthocomus hoazin TaxID=30419 RepID=UPI003F52B405